MFRVSAGDAPKELRAAALALTRADKDIRRDVATRMRDTMNPVWKAGLSQHLTGSGLMEGRTITPGARIASGNPAQLVTASSKRRIGSGGGLVPDRHWPGWEFGASKDGTSTVVSKKGKKFQRHTTRHLPARVRSGRVIGPTVADILPRIAAYWVQSVVKAFMDAAEGKK